MNILAAELVFVRGALPPAAYAVVGGIAVSVRSEPRFTRDIDLAVTAASDSEAEAIIRAAQAAGYTAATILEHEPSGRLATVRLERHGDSAGVVVDILFASSGIEPEIVAAAQTLEVWPNVQVPIARTGHLIALKTLAADDARPQDVADLQALLTVADSEEIQRAHDAVALIVARGFARGRDLEDLLAAHIRRFRT